MNVIWAFNPFEKNQKLHLFGRDLIKCLFTNKDSIEVVYVASNAEAELATAFNIPLKQRYSTYPQKIIVNLLHSIGISGYKIKILLEKKISITSVVKKLTSLTKKNKADIVLIASGNKKMLSKIILGSFAESMIHLSVCDLLVFNQDTKFQFKHPETLLYAYDFSPKGLLGLKRALFYVKKWKAKLIVVYVPVVEFAMNLEDFQSETEHKIESLKKFLNKNKIDFDIYTDFKTTHIADAVLKIAHETEAAIILTAAQANKLETLLGGSTTRNILRKSSLPTLILKV